MLSANTPDLKLVGFDDIASSLTVPQGVKVALFEHANYLGACKTFTANDVDLRSTLLPSVPALGILNDRVSSVRFGQDCPLQLYDSAGYHGPYRLFWSDVPNLAQYSFDNTVASLRVPEGKTVAAYSEPNYGGICEEFTRDNGDLFGSPSGNARISSVRVGVDVSCAPQVVFFEHLNYEGAFITFDRDNDNVRLGDLGWRDRVSSIYLRGGAKAELWYAKELCRPVTYYSSYCYSIDIASWFTVSTPDTRSSEVGEDRADSARIVI
jgi:Beta/Gamma crystallin